MSNNNKVVLASIMLAVAASLLTLNPSMITTAQAEPYGDDYRYDKHTEKTNVNIQKIKCVNSNINVNGIDINRIPQDFATTNDFQENEAAVNGEQNGNGVGGINFERNLVNICANLNFNNQLRTDVLDSISGIIPFPG